jgi:subtilisin-like proprotein convertase family protein
LSWSYNYIDVPPGYTNLTVFGTNLPATSVPPLQMYLNVTNPPTFSNYLFEADLMNCASGVYPSGVNPGNSISYGPPLQPARYWVGVYNPDPANSHEVYLLATLGGLLSPVPPTDFSDTGPSLPSDAVASDTIVISNTDLIASVNVGIVVAHPRISDLTFTLVSPSGQSVLLMENRGGDDTNGAGSTFVYTNVLNTTARGYGNPQTNYLAVPIAGITVPIIYNFYTAPDEMTVYAGDDPTTFDPVLVNPVFLLDTGFTNNPWIGPGPQDTRPETISVNVPPGYTNITIIMNQFGNPAGPNGTAWTYTAGAQVTNFEYLMFTEDTNLATLPIKYAVPPFSFAEVASNYTLSDFELATNGNYVGPTNIYDAFGGWFLPTNRPVGTNLMMWSNNIVSVVTDPRDSIGDNVGTNFLALGDGTITRSIPTIPGREYSVTFWYRGPGIAGWWRGEGNADDSSQPEGGNNGLLIGRFDFPAGEVGQAFEFEDAGQAMEFAGTNTYVQIRQSSALDVGAGGGLTVEGWINPTNLSQQMPLVEWLAKVPVFTNSADTNFSIVAGPFLNPATGHYYYMLAATNWTTSELWATNLGGHLVTIDTANEQNWVYDTFANYDATNRNLWIGLTNSYDGAVFTNGWVSGEAAVLYTNWANGQPANSCGTANYTFMLGSTNAPGLWTLANNNEVDCSGVLYSNIFGVVEVDALQTNGVQFWISVTNTPGTNNAVLDGDGHLYTNGCLYANLVDVSNVTHEIYSAAGLVQSNVYQHVALTYDTNSGVAMLYYNGTNVATTNLGVFVPKTGGDVLLGKDMSLATNGYYGGEMDEMSIYSRALSGAEIAAIYNVSVFSTNGFGNTNGLIGKFDPSVTPAYGLAEAQVAFGTTTNIIYGVNNQWELNSFTFTATSNAMPLQISGLEPGILLDDFSVSEMPLTNLYYLPEQSLDDLAGNSPFGTWTLQIWDNRANAAVTAADAQLINWELQFVLETNVLATALPMNPENPTSITVPPGQTVYLSVAVPSWASFATNVLDSATGPVNLLFNPTNEPTGANPGDQTLLTASIGGIPAGVSQFLTVNDPLPFTADYQAGQSYYLGVRNSGTHAVTAVVEADFDITGLSNSVPVCGILNTNDQERYFSYDVSSNAFEATFQLLDLSSNADLVVRKGSPLPTLFSSDYGSFNPTNADENIYVFTNSQPVPLSPGRWYLGVIKRDAGPVYYTILAKELDETNGVPGYAVIDLTNRVPFNFTAGPGAALTNFFRFNVANTVFLVTNSVNGMTNAVNGVTTNVLGSIHFEFYNLSGNGDLTVQTDAPPFAPPFLESSQEPSRDPELITIRTNGVLTNLVAQWYLGVPNHETNLITYTIIAELDTNIVFPAFPGAEGAGADAVGGRFGNVYHVTSLADSGLGTLRDAVSVPDRTIVFDLSGTIGLLSPLVITNSFLTIAGQTAPGGGIAVAGNMTTVQSAHDVIIRAVRFRSGGVVNVLTNSFQGTAADYTNGQVVANSGWTVLSNQVSLVTDSLNAYGGSNLLALANGVISNTLPTVAGTAYTLTFAYRGPGIAGWWRAENNTNDSINGNNPSSVSNITFTTGEVDRAFHYDGSTSLIAVPASSSLPVSNLTLEAWVYPTDGSTGRPIFDLGGPGQDSPVQLWINTIGGSSVNSGGLHAVIRNATSGAGYEIDDANPVVVLNKWNHVVLTATPSTGTLYCNGVQVGTTTATPLIPQSYADVDIGYRDAATGEAFVTAGRRFLGNIDEASIYNRPLSASEIKAIYTNGIAGKFDWPVFSASPAQSLAEAQVRVNGQTPTTILGNNTNWQVETIIFTATQSATPVVISGVEPGMLLDSVSVVSADDCLRLTNVSDVVVDHVSTSWSTNNLVSVLDSTNVTVQWSIMADSLTNNLHGYGSRLRYGNGALTFHHNLYADNYNASPRLGDNLQLDFVNNVVYNWGLNAGFSTNETLLDDPLRFTNELNYVCNYLIAGSNSVMTNIAFWSGTTNTWIYQTNNFMDSNTNAILDGADTGWFMFTNHYTPFQTPFPPLAVGIDEAYQAYERVLDFAGPAMDKRDTADTNIVSKVRTQTGALVSSAGMLPALISALPYLDTDQDGLPDFWEITFGTDPFTPSNNNLASDGSGYTDLEEYDNWLAGPHALTVINTTAGVDLMQLFGKTGNLSFSVTNAMQGFVYLTNVLGSVTNTGPFSNSIAVFTPTNNLPFTTNYSGYASFDVFVTNNATIAYFGPVTVSVVVSKVPVAINSNMPPVITTLTSGLLDPTNYGGSDFYKFTVTTNSSGSNAVAVLFTVTNASGPVDLLANYGLPLPSLSSYEYISTNSWTTSENIVLTPNSTPVALTNGDWYLAVVNVSGSNVTYDIKATELFTVVPPVFSSPTNGNFFTNIETTPFTTNCVATDPNTPPLPLTFALVKGPTNMTVSPAGAINWTPNEAQGPSTNLISVSVADGVFSVINSFTIIVEESNLPPVLPSIPNQVVIVPGTLVVTNTATDPDIPANPLTYSLLVAPTNNAVIDTNGVITWTPTLAQAGTNYLFTTIVTDTNQWAVNAKSLSATNSFYVTVLPGVVGGQPQSNIVPANSINWIAISVPTNAIAATNLLLFATNLPVNVWFSTNLPPTTTNANDVDLMPNATNGVSVLTTHSAPTNIVPGNIYFLGVQNNNSFAVTYGLEVNFLLATPSGAVTNTISISSIIYTNIGGKNGFLLKWFAPSNDLFQVQWTASLAPASWAAFTSIVSYNPGAFTSPTNTQFNFFDDGSQTVGFGPTRFYRLILLPSPNTLTLPPQSNFVVNAAATVTVTNTATDSSAGAVLTYSLINSPTNASISTNGIITWTNAIPSGSATRFNTLVTDNGVPPAHATNTFTVFVAPFPAITGVTVTATNVTLQWSAPTNDQFQVQWTTNLMPVINWFTFPAILTSTNGAFTFTDTNAPLLIKFYRLLLLP